ncbi:MAG: TonB-dependent receptor plug domain-containing protein [Verrucomicrobia bacterium]|nr:TonB-dependent receptor plug domain-containing protein [Verrucomicrobiota bacterium]
MPSHPRSAFLAASVLGAASAFAQTAPAPASSASDARTDEVVTIQEFQVNADNQRDTWFATQAMSGTRTAQPLIESPYQVQVITHEFLEDFKLLALGEQMSYFSGYQSDSNLSDAAINFTAAAATFRGFGVTIIRDGFRRTPPPQIGNIYQMEVIKGPISTLYGAAQPGGLINYVSKRPSTRPEYKLSFSAGSYGYLLGSLNASGPLYKDKVFYLLGVEHYYRRSNYQYVYSRNGDYTLTLLWKPTTRTSVSVQAQAQRLIGARAAAMPLLVAGTTRPATNPLAWTGGITVGLYWPLVRSGFSPFGPNERYHRDYDGVNVLVEHAYNETWKQRFSYQWFDKDFSLNYRTTSNLSAETLRFTNIFPRSRVQHYYAPQAFQTDLLGSVTVAGLKHTLLFTGDYSQENLRDFIIRYPAAVENALPTSIRYSDPANPDWSPLDYSRTALSRRTSETMENYELAGFSLSDRVSILQNRLLLMGNLRYDYSRQSTDSNPNAVAYVGGKDEAVTYSAGVNWRIQGDALVAFANHSTSFNTNVTADAGTGEIIPNERGAGTELGLKSLALQQRLGLSTSLFEIEKKNIGQSNPDYREGNGQAQFLGSGVERVRGVDGDVNFKVTPRFTLIGSAAYLDARVVKSSSAALTGTRKITIPRTTGSIAVRYNFIGSLKGVSTGASLRYTGSFVRANGTATRRYETSAPVQLYSAYVKYTWRRGGTSQTLAVNGNNLFDKLYVGPGLGLALGRQINFSYTLAFR